MSVKEDGELPVEKERNEELDDSKSDIKTDQSEDDSNKEEAEKEALELEEKKYMFSEKQWKLIVSIIGTGLIITLIILTLNLVNTLLKSES